MRLIYLSNLRFPSERAHSVQIAQMCRAFAEVGYDVTLLSGNRKSNYKKNFEESYGFTPNFKIFKIRYGLIFIPSSRVFLVLNSFFFIIFASFKLKFREYDKFYFRDEWLAFAFCLLFPSLRSKVIFESHEARLAYPAKFILNKGIKCVVISEGILDFYLSSGIRASQLLVAHDGIDESFFETSENKSESRKRLNINSIKSVAMYIGGLDKWKGVETFFEAADLSDEIEFVVIGGKEDEIKKYADQYRKVKFVGQRPYSELKNNQQAADVLIIPNTAKNDLSAKYTSPLKLFAHMTAKVPLVVSDVPSLKNVVNEREVTFFKSDDAEDLVKKIIESLNSENKGDKIQACFELAKQYTWKNRVEAIKNFVK